MLVVWLGVGPSGRARGDERVGAAGVPVAPVAPAAPVEVVASVAPVGVVADEAIMPPRRLLLSVGAGYANMSYPVEAGLRNTLVAGAWNMEAALGLGHELEAGLRLGLRTWAAPPCAPTRWRAGRTPRRSARASPRSRIRSCGRAGV